MKEQIFYFKQFTVKQHPEVMKVGTDGVLLGAFADFSACKQILDVGTGTGLIALMAAQKNPDARITGIDQQDAAFRRAKENFKLSAYGKRLKAIKADFKDFSKTERNSFDHIVCNPPFFQEALLPRSEALAYAKHNLSLGYSDLVSGAKLLLSESGLFSVIIPAKDEKYFIELCRKNELYPTRLLRVKPTPEKSPKRVLISFSNEKRDYETAELIIECGGRHTYSDEYKQLTRDFYLNF